MLKVQNYSLDITQFVRQQVAIVEGDKALCLFGEVGNPEALHDAFRFLACYETLRGIPDHKLAEAKKVLAVFLN